MKKSYQQWMTYGKQPQKSIVLINELVYDLGMFLKVYPDCSQALKKQKNKDITDILLALYDDNEVKAIQNSTLQLLGINTSSPHYTEAKVCINAKSIKKNKKTNNQILGKQMNTKKTLKRRVSIQYSLTYNVYDPIQANETKQIIQKSSISNQKSQSLQIKKGLAKNKEQNNTKQCDETGFSAQDDLSFELESNQNKKTFKIPIMSINAFHPHV